MTATGAVPSGETNARPQLSRRTRILVWVLRLLLLFLFIKVAKDPLPLLRSRTFPSLLLWIGFFVYWAIAGRNSAATKTAESRASKWFHAAVLNLALVLLLWPAPGLTRSFLPQYPHLVVVGAVVQVAFMVLAIWARRHLGRNWSAEVRIGVAHQLVSSGPYRLLRHPIYTAMLGMFLGTMISSGRYHALAGLGILVLAYLRKTRLEEQILQQTFGNEFEEYRRRTWALVPWVF